MKKMIKFLFTAVAIFLLLAGCGERGPVGPEGPQGPAGPSLLPTSFEFLADLTQTNGFEHFQDIPGSIDMYDSDVILAYVLEDYIEEDDLEVWRKLPVTEFTERGTNILDFDFTFVDVRVFLHANYNLGSVDEFRDLLIRAVHIPADFASGNKAAKLKGADTFDELEKMLGVEIQPAGSD